MADEATSEVTATIERLGRRYVDLVYGAAVRQMGGEGRGAEDVTQSVFLVAMRKAKSGGLPEEGRMAGWLLKVTRYAVKRARREEWRRKRHEKWAAAAEAVEQEVEVDAVRMVLDEALLKLGDMDREVVVRRYLQGQAVGEVAAAVGMTRNTATQRIGRVLEKLRKILARRGVTMPVGGVVAVLGAEAAIKAPAAVAASVSLGTAGASAAAVSIAKGAAVMMKVAMVKMVAGVVLAVVLLGGVGVMIAQETREAPPSADGVATLPFTLGRDTTGITEPLRADGTPDYVKALNDRYGKGVTPETNGLVVWLQVVGSNVLPTDSRARILALSGAQPPANGQGVDGAIAFTGAIDDINSLRTHLWSAKEHPELAAYLDSHGKMLALAVEASQKPRWWVPAVSRDRTLAWIQSPNLRLATVARALCARATLRAQAGDFDGFLSDVMAVERLARLTMDWSGLSHMMGAGCGEFADQAIGAVAGARKLSAAQCAALGKALDGLERLPSMVEVMDVYSRWRNMESIQYIALRQTHRALGDVADSEDMDGYVQQFGTIDRDAVDWDIALTLANKRADETLAILKQPLMKDEIAGRDAFMRNISEIIVRPHGDMARKPDEAKEAYSIRVSEMLLGIDPWKEETQRREAAMQEQMARALVAVARYRAETGGWPASLDELVPAYLKEVPKDIYSSGSVGGVRYAVGREGARVYSVGKNRVDDGGVLDVVDHGQANPPTPKRDDIVVGVLER